MRISVRKDDRGYDRIAAQGAKVYVDGVDVSCRCYTADEEQGKAWCFLHDERGQLLREGDSIAEEVLIGAVKIVIAQA